MSVNEKLGAVSQEVSLCDSCKFAHIERGYRESEEVVFCSATYWDHRVTFYVRDCSAYVEKQRQSLERMEEIGWIIEPRGPKRPAGFAAAGHAPDNGNEIKPVLNDDPDR